MIDFTCEQCGNTTHTLCYCRMCGKLLCPDCFDKGEGFCSECHPLWLIARQWVKLELELKALKHMIETQLDKRKVKKLQRDKPSHDGDCAGRKGES